MEKPRRLARTLIWRPNSIRQARVKRETWVTHPIDFDIGEVADGYHLIAQSISLSMRHLLFEFAFVPELEEGTEAWLNMSYTADIPVSQDHMGHETTCSTRGLR